MDAWKLLSAWPWSCLITVDYILHLPYLRPNGQPVSVVEDPLEEAHLVGVTHDEGHMGGRQRGRGQEGLAAHQLVAPVSQDGGDAQVADEGQVAVAHQQVDDGQAEVLY